MYIRSRDMDQFVVNTATPYLFRFAACRSGKAWIGMDRYGKVWTGMDSGQSEKVCIGMGRQSCSHLSKDRYG